MGKLTAGLIALALALGSITAFACPGDKAADGNGQMSTPSKPKT